MAGLQGIGAQGVGFNNQGGVGGVDRLGTGGQQGGSPLDQIKQLFQQLLERVLQGGNQAQGAQEGGKPQGAQGGQNAGQAGAEGAGGIDELVQKLRELAQQNPEAFKQALAQNPAFMAVAQAALSGGGGGGSIGKV